MKVISHQPHRLNSQSQHVDEPSPGLQRGLSDLALPSTSDHLVLSELLECLVHPLQSLDDRRVESLLGDQADVEVLNHLTMELLSQSTPPSRSRGEAEAAM